MKAFVITDLGYGDSGKGSITDFLCRKYNIGMVIRHNGGPQAGHNVVTDDDKEHTFSQFGAGTFVGVQTYLSKHMLVNPLTHLVEERHLYQMGINDAFSRLTIHEDAIIITPFHKLMNQIKELMRGNGRHGSCGHGVGETQSFALDNPQEAIYAKDLYNRQLLREKLSFIREVMVSKLLDMGIEDASYEVGKMKGESIDMIADAYVNYALRIFVDDGTWLNFCLRQQNVVFEGAQGVLLDENYGFHPYTTWSTTTAKNAVDMMEGYDSEIIKLGLIRAYMTRHGPGPFVSETPNLHLGAFERWNKFNEWQRDFRIGYADLMAWDYAIRANEGIDYLCISHLDMVDHKITAIEKYSDVDEIDWFEIPIERHENIDDQLIFQSELTENLFKCQGYQTDIYVSDIVPGLGVKLGITSSSEKASGKECFI